MNRRYAIASAAKTFLGVSLLNGPRLYAAGKGASPLKQIPTAKNVIYLYMGGGMSHLDTWDPKPGNEVMGLTKTINTRTAGMRVSDNLPLLAKQSEKLAVVRSLNSTQGAHKQGNYYLHTSYTLRSSIRHPAMGAWLQKFQEPANTTLPSNVMIGNDSQHPGAGFFESKFAPLMIGNPSRGLQNSKRLKELGGGKFERGLDIASQLDASFVERYNTKNVRAYSDMYADAVRLMESSDLAAFDISKEPSGIRERYGNDSFGQGCLLARRLVEAGVRFVEVSLNSWDTHNANFTRVPENCAQLDTAMSALLVDLERRGMLDETLVVLTTEFGRTPEINANDGRDHHPSAFSSVLAGGGIRGGQVFGTTNETGSAIEEKKVTPPDLNATIAYALGLPLDAVLYSPSKRPFTVADKGKPITELFG